MIKCIKCNKYIPDDSVFCNYCGKKQVAKKISRRPNDTGSAYRRGKSWTAKVTVGHIISEDGTERPRRITKGGFKTKADALNYCSILRMTPKEKLCRMNLQQLYKKWEPWYEPKVGKSTMDCYKAAFKYFKSIYAMPFLEISPGDLQKCIDDCPKGKRTKQNMKATASLLYQYAMFKEIITVNKSETLDVGDDPTQRVPPITSAELKIIQASNEKYAPYVVVLCYMGCRPNELFKLKKTDLDELRHCVITGSKTPAGLDRIITISPKIWPIFMDQLKTPGEYLFPCLPADSKKGHKGGEFMTVNHFEDLFKDLMTKLGIENRVPYSCRHTFSNLLKAVKGSDTDKASLMGHADASMTKYYQEADYDSLRAITDAL